MIQIDFYLSPNRFIRSLNWSKENFYQIANIGFDLKFRSFGDLLSTERESELINLFKDSEASALILEDFDDFIHDKPSVLFAEFTKRGSLHELSIKGGFREDQMSCITSFLTLAECQQKDSILTIKISTHTADKFLLDWSMQLDSASLEISTFRLG
jgi:hypothetical protein